jgi:cytochrome c peroxidase
MLLPLLLAAITIPLGLDLYLPVPEANPLTVEKIELGRRLFNDRRLSRDQSIACSTCHQPKRAFSDGRAIAVGVAGRTGKRNAPALINRGYGRAFFWDGRSASLEEQVLKPIQDPNEMDLALEEASRRVGLDAQHIAESLASYVRSILSGDSPYDRYVNGDREALSPMEQAGLQVFRGKGNCTACHVGPNFSDEKFHDTGVAWKPASESAPAILIDEGRFAISHRPEDQGAFKTPTLREVARTAPYMHNGSLSTLEAVVDFYNGGGRPNPELDADLRPLHLSAADKRALIAFLKSLSGRIQDGPSVLITR